MKSTDRTSPPSILTSTSTSPSSHPFSSQCILILKTPIDPSTQWKIKHIPDEAHSSYITSHLPSNDIAMPHHPPAAIQTPPFGPATIPNGSHQPCILIALLLRKTTPPQHLTTPLNNPVPLPDRHEPGRPRKSAARNDE